MDNIEKNIIEETYKAIEDYDNCKQIASEYENCEQNSFKHNDNSQLIPVENSKFSSLKLKIKNIFNTIQLFIKSFMQNKESVKEYVRTKTMEQNNMYDINAKTIRVHTRAINEKILAQDSAMYKEEELRYGNSRPIFYKSNESSESAVIKKQPDNSVEKGNRVWNNVSYANGEKRDIEGIDR